MARRVLSEALNKLCHAPRTPRRHPPTHMLTITLCLFLAGIAMGAAFACVWAWGVRSGQFRNLEDSKQQVFWPDIAPDAEPALTLEKPMETPKGNA